MAFDLGHLRSQKFAALVFCAAVCFGAGFAFTHEIFSTLVMGLVALYTTFVGGRAYSDGQALKFGTTVDPAQKAPATTTVKKPLTAKEKEEVD